MATAIVPSFEAGYDEVFVDVEIDFICPVCHLVLRDPLTPEECGHPVCAVCLVRM